MGIDFYLSAKKPKTKTKTEETEEWETKPVFMGYESFFWLIVLKHYTLKEICYSAKSFAVSWSNTPDYNCKLTQMHF